MRNQKRHKTWKQKRHKIINFELRDNVWIEVMCTCDKIRDQKQN